MATQQTRGKSLYRELLLQAVAGGTAGGIETAIMHPLDLIKTRFQVVQVTRLGKSEIFLRLPIFSATLSSVTSLSHYC